MLGEQTCGRFPFSCSAPSSCAHPAGFFCHRCAHSITHNSKNAALSTQHHSEQPPRACVMVVFMTCVLLEGVPNMAEGRMGADAGGHFP